MSNNEETPRKKNLKTTLVNTLVREHTSRSTYLKGVLDEIKGHIEEGADEAEVNIALESLSNVFDTYIKNDTNLLKLLEILMKYNDDDIGEEDVKNIQDALSSNPEDIDVEFDED